MELAPLFTEQRWNILKHLSAESLSPIQLAKLSNTTIANISQQLRLLEAANLVSKVKVPNRDKGQPRSLFSLTDDYAYIVSLMSHFAEKKLIKLTSSQRRLIRILSIDDPQQRERMAKLYFTLHCQLDKVSAIAIDLAAASFLLVSADKDALRKLSALDGVQTIAEEKLGELVRRTDADNLLIIDDPSRLFFAAATSRDARKRKSVS